MRDSREGRWAAPARTTTQAFPVLKPTATMIGPQWEGQCWGCSAVVRFKKHIPVSFGSYVFCIFSFMIFGPSTCQKPQQDIGKGSYTNMFHQSPNLWTKMVTSHFSRHFHTRLQSWAHLFVCVIYLFIYLFWNAFEYKPCDRKKDPIGVRHGGVLCAGTHSASQPQGTWRFSWNQFPFLGLLT